MIDIISKTDRVILQEILGQNALSGITLAQIIDLVRVEVTKNTEQLIEELILKGKASAIIQDFKSAQPFAYEKMKAQIEGNETV